MAPGRLLAFLLLGASAAPAPGSFQARVVSITDGDTFTVLDQRRQIRIRLYGVDCPESGQPFHRRATQRTAELIFGKTVTIEPRSRDRYGRLVASVLLTDGRSLNHLLVAEGLAWHYRQFAPRDYTLARLEQSARRARRGLWQDPAPVPPWQWRRMRRGARQWSLP